MTSRRRLLEGFSLSAGIAATSALHSILQPASAIPQTDLRAELDSCIPQGDLFEALLQRNQVFSKAWRRSMQSSDPKTRMQIKQAIFDESCHINPLALVQGQRPWAAILSCADARVAPEWIFGLGSGELFQVRVAGNSAFNDGIASLEYAVAVLETPLIVVVGHSGCGAVKAAMGKEPLTPLLEDLVQPIRESLRSGDDLTQAIQGNAQYAARQITQRSNLIAEAKDSGKVRIIPVYFDLNSGLISKL